MILTQTYPNGVTRAYSVSSYALDNVQNAAILETEADSSVAISETDTPELWSQFTGHLTP